MKESRRNEPGSENQSARNIFSYMINIFQSQVYLFLLQCVHQNIKLQLPDKQTLYKTMQVIKKQCPDAEVLLVKEVPPYPWVNDQISVSSYLSVFRYRQLNLSKCLYTTSRASKNEQPLFAKLLGCYLFVNKISCLITFNDIIY